MRNVILDSHLVVSDSYLELISVDLEREREGDAAPLRCADSLIKGEEVGLEIR